MWLILAIAWAGLIAGTSSTVILSREFFAAVNSHVFTDKTSFGVFAAFWRSGWFVIVKGWHAAEFAILFGLVLAVLDRKASSRRIRNIVLALTLCVLFAISDEYHQTFVPGRGGTLADVAIDGLGACSAAMIAWLRPQARLSGRTPA